MKIFSLVVISIVLLFGCSSQKFVGTQKRDISEEEYYSTFTEATKHALLGNFKNALQLYQLCIHEFPERAASYYQVSSIYSTVNDISKAKYFGKKAVEIDDSNKWYLLGQRIL